MTRTGSQVRQAADRQALDHDPFATRNTSRTSLRARVAAFLADPLLHPYAPMAVIAALLASVSDLDLSFAITFGIWMASASVIEAYMTNRGPFDPETGYEGLLWAGMLFVGASMLGGVCGMVALLLAGEWLYDLIV